MNKKSVGIKNKTKKPSRTENFISRKSVVLL
jgi:hypothetical protein